MSVSPIAPRTPTTRLHHGDEFVDHYEWLRDKDDADVQAHLENENAYTESSTAHLADLRENIFQEIKGRTRETDMSVPGRKGDWWYYRRIEEGQNYSRLCRVPLTSPDDWNPPEIESIEHEQEQVLLDSNLEADEHAFFQLGSTALSHDHNLLAWTVDTEGDERYRLNIRNLHDGSQQDAVVTDIALFGHVTRRASFMCVSMQAGALSKCGATTLGAKDPMNWFLKSQTSATS